MQGHCTCNQRGAVFCCCMWLKGAYVFQSIEQGAREKLHNADFFLYILVSYLSRLLCKSLARARSVSG